MIRVPGEKMIVLDSNPQRKKIWGYNWGYVEKSYSEFYNENKWLSAECWSSSGTIAQFECALIVERTKAGMEAAKANGRFPGRPPAVTPQVLEEALFLISGGLPVLDTARHLGVGRSTLYKHLADLQVLS